MGHAMQASPLLPHWLVLAPFWQVPSASQQPSAQVVRSHFFGIGPQEEAATPRASPQARARKRGSFEAEEVGMASTGPGCSPTCANNVGSGATHAAHAPLAEGQWAWAAAARVFASSTVIDE